MSRTNLNLNKAAVTTKAVPRNRLDFTNWSPRTAARVAGLALALMAVLGGFGNFGVLVQTIIPGDAELTAENISGRPLLYFAGVASFAVVALLDIIVAGAFYTLLKSVNARLAAVAAWLRTIYAVLLVGALSQLVVGFAMLSDPASALPVLESFNSIWVIIQGMFGVSLLLVGYLAFCSGFVQKIFGILLVIAGVGYLADSIGMALVPGFTAVFAQFMFVGEVAIIFWLLIKGRRLSAN